MKKYGIILGALFIATIGYFFMFSTTEKASYFKVDGQEFRLASTQEQISSLKNWEKRFIEKFGNKPDSIILLELHKKHSVKTVHNSKSKKETSDEQERFIKKMHGLGATHDQLKAMNDELNADDYKISQEFLKAITNDSTGKFSNSQKAEAYLILSALSFWYLDIQNISIFCDNALLLDPDNFLPLQTKANFHWSLGLLTQAEQYYYENITILEKKNPHNAHSDLFYPYERLSFFYVDKKDFVKANEYFLKSIKIAETYPQIISKEYLLDQYASFAETLYKNSNNEALASIYYLKAVKLFEDKQVPEANSNLAYFYYMIAVIYDEKLRSNGLAELYYKKAVETSFKDQPINMTDFQTYYNKYREFLKKKNLKFNPKDLQHGFSIMIYDLILTILL